MSIATFGFPKPNVLKPMGNEASKTPALAHKLGGGTYFLVFEWEQSVERFGRDTGAKMYGFVETIR